MASSLALNCLILGDYSSQVFKTVIEDNKTINSLRQVIKESVGRDLRDIADKDIFIRIIDAPIPVDDDVDSIVTFELAVFEALASRSRRGSQILSEVFLGDLDDRNLHVIVDVKNYISATVKLNCFVRSESISVKSTFTVTLNRRDRVSELGDAIRKAVQFSHGYVLTGGLDIWSVSIPLDDSFEERVKEFGSHQQVLLPHVPLSVCFPVEPNPGYLHVIIEAPKGVTKVSSTPSEHFSQLVGGQREQFTRDNPPEAPSSLGVPRAYFDRQGKEQHQILCGRPWDASSIIPIELLHPVFGEFVDDCQTCEVTEVDNANVLEMRKLMSQYYDAENLRADVIRRELKEKWELPFLRTKLGEYESDGDISIDGFRYALTGFKNEVAVGGAEPYLQGGLYYLEATRYIASRYSNSVLPCFLILIFGPCLSVVGAGWTVRPITQVLSTLLPFHYHYTDVEMQSTIARHMCALKKGIHSLKQYYKRLRPTSPKRHPQCFPYPTQFWDLRSDTQRTFEYTAQISQRKLVFSAVTAESSREIMIKFARTYSKEVHLFCAEKGYAPALLGFQRLPGGWFMVVMESLRGQYVDLVGCNDVPPGLYDQIEERLGDLHQNCFVHGDLRKANIMVSKDKTLFMLLDFDWSGKIGEVKYPPNVNKKDIKRPADVRDGQLIKAEHDMEMLEFMKQ